MRRAILTAILAGAGLAGAGAGAGPPTLLTSGPVTALAATSNDGRGHRVAFIVRERGCEAVQAWRLTGPPQTLATRNCKSTAYGLSISQYAVLWATMTPRGAGARLFEVWRASSGWAREGSFSTPYGKRVRLFHRLVPRGQPVPLVMGDRAYAVDATIYDFNGRRFPDIPPLAYRPETIFASEPGLSVAVLSTAGALEVYQGARAPNDPFGPYATFDFARGSVKAIKDGAVLEPRRLSWWSGRFRGPPGEIPVPDVASYGDDRCYRPICPLAALRLADTQGPYAIYVQGRAIHVLRPLDGKDKVVRTPPVGPVHAQMEPGGITYSSGKRISYVPRDEIDALFGP
jgi:hypothetical protein